MKPALTLKYNAADQLGQKGTYNLLLVMFTPPDAAKAYKMAVGVNT